MFFKEMSDEELNNEIEKTNSNIVALQNKLRMLTHEKERRIARNYPWEYPDIRFQKE
ncbi:hypothetical protein [Paenibacillus medicaginis]|uniref:Uncharacterized protein n=1 Tax=Paenibacillus medicaginis TaxID=1470560 RepID=A0ABV5BV01_9BACL